MTNAFYYPITWHFWQTLSALGKLGLSPYRQNLALAIECIDRLRAAGVIDDV